MTAATLSPSFEKLRSEVINRVMPGLRHRMLGKLQPIALLSQVLSKKLSNGSVDQDYVQTQVEEIKLNSRLLTTATQNLFSWIALDNAIKIPANELLDECIDLLKMECHTHHLIISNHVSSTQLLPALETRVLICAGIILLIDIDGTGKELDIQFSDGGIQFKWNAACNSSNSSNNEMLRNWDWIKDISPMCQLEHIDSGIRFNFQH